MLRRRMLPSLRSLSRRRWLAWVGAGAILALTALATTGQRALAAEEAPALQLIVHPENRSGGETRDFLTDAFLKKVSQWSDGTPLKPVDQRPEAEVRLRFSKGVLRRSVQAVRHYWQQKIFSGGGVPPPELDSDRAVVSYVLKHRGAVGYVHANADVSNARVLSLR